MPALDYDLLRWSLQRSGLSGSSFRRLGRTDTGSRAGCGQDPPSILIIVACFAPWSSSESSGSSSVSSIAGFSSSDAEASALRRPCPASCSSAKAMLLHASAHGAGAGSASQGSCSDGASRHSVEPRRRVWDGGRLGRAHVRALAAGSADLGRVRGVLGVLGVPPTIPLRGGACPRVRVGIGRTLPKLPTLPKALIRLGTPDGSVGSRYSPDVPDTPASGGG